MRPALRQTLSSSRRYQPYYAPATLTPRRHTIVLTPPAKEYARKETDAQKKKD